MAIKKSELYSTLWKSCDELRGGMDASQYKDYVLVLLFVKYVSDKYADDPDAPIDVPKGKPGYGGSFTDMVFWKNQKEIGDKLNVIIRRLAEANELSGVIDVADFNDSDKLGKGQDMVDRLTKLVALFEKPELNFKRNRADGDDILGDAYEYLMRHFATESGKSKGQFYTPAEVSRILAKVIGIPTEKAKEVTIYDPTCGSGSLLLKAADEAHDANVSLFGQEYDVATRALATMNMWLHGFPTAEIEQGNTLSQPHFLDKNQQLKTFDFVVANPPFSQKNWTSGVTLTESGDSYERFDGYGVPPEKNGDYAFLLHIVKSLKSRGKGAVILPHGVLFRGNAEADIRRNLIRKGYIKGIIGLPANLFYGTGIPACIIVLDKENADNRKGIFFIDASKGFIKDGNKNRLREQDIHRIVDVFHKAEEQPKFSRMVPVSEIEKNDYNLNIPRYIDSQESEDIHDISAHLLGGIPAADVDALQAYWEQFPGLQRKLFSKSDRKGYFELKVDKDLIKPAIFEHPEFTAYAESVREHFSTWRKKHGKALKAIAAGCKPREIIETLSESLLQTFGAVHLLDAYDVYQQLMVYWESTLKDDLYLIAEDGWSAEPYQPILKVKEKEKKGDWQCDLLSLSLVESQFFGKQRAAIEALQAQADTLERELEELKEEHGGDDGLLVECLNDKGNLAKAEASRRLKDIKASKADAEERKLIETVLAKMERSSELNAQIKSAERDLQSLVLKQYSKISAEELKTLVVERKWMDTLQTALDTEVERITQRLAARIKTLAERYEAPLPQLTSEVAQLSKAVDNHLKKMGFAW